MCLSLRLQFPDGRELLVAKFEDRLECPSELAQVAKESGYDEVVVCVDTAMPTYEARHASLRAHAHRHVCSLDVLALCFAGMSGFVLPGLVR